MTRGTGTNDMTRVIQQSRARGFEPRSAHWNNKNRRRWGSETKDSSNEGAWPGKAEASEACGGRPGRGSGDEGRPKMFQRLGLPKLKLVLDDFLAL